MIIKRLILIFLFFSSVINNIMGNEKTLIHFYESDKQLNKELSKWLHFHNIKVDDFKFQKVADLSLEQDSGSIYQRDFEKEQKIYNPILNIYSPNKKKYINLLSTKGVYWHKVDKQYYYGGGDDCEEIYYIDLNSETNNFIRFNGSFQLTENALWINNNIFILVSKSNYSEFYKYHIDIYRIIKEKRMIKKESYILQNEDEISYNKDYFLDIVLKERNIKVED